MYKQRTNSKQTTSLIELKVYHNKIRTESYSKNIMNQTRKDVDFDEMKHVVEDELTAECLLAAALWRLLFGMPLKKTNE